LIDSRAVRFALQNECACVILCSVNERQGASGTKIAKYSYAFEKYEGNLDN